MFGKISPKRSLQCSVSSRPVDLLLGLSPPLALGLWAAGSAAPFWLFGRLQLGLSPPLALGVWAAGIRSAGGGRVPAPWTLAAWTPTASGARTPGRRATEARVLCRCADRPSRPPFLFLFKKEVKILLSKESKQAVETVGSESCKGGVARAERRWAVCSWLR